VQSPNVVGLQYNFPDSPVGRRVQALREAVPSEGLSTKDLKEHYSEEMIEWLQPTPERLRMLFAALSEVEEISDLDLFLSFTVPGIGRLVGYVEVDPAPPHKIIKGGVTPQLKGGAAGTALACATTQALLVSRGSTLFEDVFAERLLGEEGRGLLEFFRSRGGPAAAIGRAITPRFVEDRLFKAIDRGIDQYVILGAGLDSFALRHPGLLSDLAVYEVDLPATQDWKRKTLREESLEEPQGLHFVPVDFDTDDFMQELKKSGFDPEKPAFFSCLNVTWYVEREAVERTLRSIASNGPGTDLVFNYMLPEEQWSEQSRLLSSLKLMRRVGEPWISFFTPEQMANLMADLGFSEIEDLSEENLGALYPEHKSLELVEDSRLRLIAATV
jgi:methyltransferase (TIGR00027 family)